MAKKREEKQPREYTKRQLSHAKKQQIRQRIYLFSGITVIVAVIVLTLAGWLFGEYLPLNKVIAKVYDAEIKEIDLIDTMIAYGNMQTSFDVEQNMDSILQAMVQNELIRQAAEKLGITVSDEELDEAVKQEGVEDALRELYRATLLNEKLRDEHFNDLVPDSGNQVLMNAMLVESEEFVPEIRARLLSGDNFTLLAEEYALNTVSKNNKGVFDWHPQSILDSSISSKIPAEWAFRADVNKGDISDALSDNQSSKLLGYWLIRLNEDPEITGEETSANVSALLLRSEAEALRIKAQLETGDNLSMLADTFSQYSPSQQGHGDMIAVQSDNISTEFNNYVFDAGTQLGTWSEPIKDTRYWTKGGAWIVQIVDKSDDHPYSEDDKSSLIDSAFSEWTSQLWIESTTDIGYFFDEPERQLAIERTNKKLVLLQG